MNSSNNHFHGVRSGSCRHSVVPLVAGVALLGLCASVSLIAQDENSSTASFVTDQVPQDLQEALAPLDNNWQAWSDSVSAELAQLYAGGQSYEALRTHLAVLQKRLAVVEKSLDDPRYRSIESPLRNLQGKLARRLAVLEAALNTLQLPPEARSEQLAADAKSISAALAALESHLKSIKNGESWLVYLKADALKTALAGSEAEITPAVEDLEKRLAHAEQDTDAAVRDFVAINEFQSLKSAASDYLLLAKNPSTTNNGPATTEQLQVLITNLESYESQPSTAAAEAVRKAFQELQSGTIDGGALIEAALRTNYFNYNMRVLATEAFINKFVSESRQETGPVRDFILGADVTGCQTTVTDISFDLKPDAHNARFEIKLAGRVNSNTQGVTHQATVFTHGTHFFWAEKPVIFDGDLFHTERARIAVNANNNTVGARTKISGIPLLGGLADSFAVGQAEKKRPQSEAIARQRVSSRVIPRLNEDVDAEFAKANLDLDANVDVPLRELGIFPDAMSFRTTEDELSVATRVMGSGELGAGTPYGVTAPKDGALVQVHESWMNNSIDRMELAAKTMSEDDLKLLFENRLKKLLGEDFKLPEGEVASDYEEEEDDSGPAVLVFADHDPIRIHVADNLLIIRLMAGVQREDDEDIPTQEITISLKFNLEGDKIRVEREGGIRVAPAEKAASALKQITFAGVIKSIFQRATPPRLVDRKRDVTYQNRKVTLNIADVQAQDGWLRISLD